MEKEENNGREYTDKRIKQKYSKNNLRDRKFLKMFCLFSCSGGSDGSVNRLTPLTVRLSGFVFLLQFYV
jgi:hypothetical protein